MDRFTSLLYSYKNSSRPLFKKRIVQYYQNIIRLKQKNNKQGFIQKALTIFFAVLLITLADLPFLAYAFEFPASPLHPKIEVITQKNSY